MEIEVGLKLAGLSLHRVQRLGRMPSDPIYDPAVPGPRNSGLSFGGRIRRMLPSAARRLRLLVGLAIFVALWLADSFSRL